MDQHFLAADFPRLYHVAEAGSWESIERNGLLSTSALLDLFEVSGETRQRLEEQHRPEAVELRHPLHGTAVIRDQKPLNMARLEGCLTGMTSTEWLRELNRRVFLWPSAERLDRLLGAKAYRERAHDVLVIDTRPLVERYRRQITLAPINTGATVPTAALRGPRTFQAIEFYDYDAMKRKRGAKEAIAEVAIDYSVPDVAEFVLQVERRQKGGPVRRFSTPA
jgi:hypothetical protein